MKTQKTGLCTGLLAIRQLNPSEDWLDFRDYGEVVIFPGMCVTARKALSCP